MKTYRVYCKWEVGGYYDIRAKTRAEAINLAEAETLPPPNGEYICGTFVIGQAEIIQHAYQEKRT